MTCIDRGRDSHLAKDQCCPFAFNPACINPAAMGGADPRFLFAAQDAPDHEGRDVDSQRRAESFVEIDRHVAQPEIEVTLEFACVPHREVDTIGNLVGSAVDNNRVGGSRVGIDRRDGGTEQGGSYRQHPAAGAQVDNTGAGRNEPGQQTQYETSRRVASAAEGTPGVDHEIHRARHSVEPGWSDDERTSTMNSCVVAPGVEAFAITDPVIRRPETVGGEQGSCLVDEGSPKPVVEFLHADGTEDPQGVSQQCDLATWAIGGARNLDQMVHAQGVSSSSPCWRRKRSNSAARSSPSGMAASV